MHATLYEEQDEELLGDQLTALTGAHAARCICPRAQCRLASSQVMDNSHGTAPTFRCGQSLRSELRLRQRLKPADFGVNAIEPRAPNDS